MIMTLARIRLGSKGVKYRQVVNRRDQTPDVCRRDGSVGSMPTIH
jgi:hypothetical protein